MVFFLNEYSLNGQFETVDEFVNNELRGIVRCINLIKKNNIIAIAKTIDFCDSMITNECKLVDIDKKRYSDEMTKIRILFANEIYNGPFWDDEFNQNIDALYYWNGKDVSATSMAEAAETNSPLLSFRREGLIDQDVEIEKVLNDINNTFVVASAHSEKYLVEKFNNILKIDKLNLLKIMFRDTRLDFSQLEEKYGVDTLDEQEYELLKSTLVKFAAHESFNSIDLDDGLEYKKYTPNQKEKDWFASLKYKDKTIMKFRFSRKKRAFGYRKGEKFFVLRLELDHSVSDYG